MNVLNIIGSIPAYNHMFFSDGGGLDFKMAELANEDDCIYIKDTGGICFLVKPKCLYYEGFDEKFRWNYFLLELDDLEPILEKNNVVDYEYLVEDFPAHYVSAKYEQYGVYDYDSGEKLPEGFKCVNRYLRGKFLIVLKRGPYNAINATYDGRHGMCNNKTFRKYLENVIGIVEGQVNKGRNEKTVLNSQMVSKNPFMREDEYDNITINKEDWEETSKFILKHYKEWCFKELYKNNGLKDNIRFYITYKSGNESFSSIFEDSEYLCKDGFIRKLNSDHSNEIYYLYIRDNAISLRQKCNNLIKKMCESERYDITECSSNFSINIERIGKPKHLFSKDEIAKIMRDADDRRNNKLVIDENGYPRLLQNMHDGYLYPVSHEAWGAGNMYVGKYSNLSTLDDVYLSSLQGWLMYLEYGKHQSIDYYDESEDVSSLLAKIQKFY